MSRSALLFLTLVMSGAVRSGDFLDDPKALCGYFESLGMKAQMQWGPAPQGGTYFCQYADEFSSTSTHVRGAQAYVDPSGKTVGMGLSIQSLGGSLVRAEVADALTGFVAAFYASQGRTPPAGLAAALASKSPVTLKDGGIELSNTDAKIWETHYVLGASWKRPASPAQLATVKTSVSPAEKARVAGVQSKLEARCAAAVTASGQGADAKALKKKVTPLSASRILVELSDAKGSFVCQVCDDEDPKVNCGTMGLMLSYRGADGSNLNLPAEIERKCVGSLQKEVMDDDAGVFIDHDIVKRIVTREIPNDKRYVFEHQLDGETYRCVVRKGDLNFTLEHQGGDGEWHGLVGGILL